MKRFILLILTVALGIAATDPASAGTLAPLSSFATQVVSWAGNIAIIAFVGVIAAVVFAHDHLTAMFGTLTRAIIAIALLVLGSTWLASLGINATQGVSLR